MKLRDLMMVEKHNFKASAVLPYPFKFKVLHATPRCMQWVMLTSAPPRCAVAVVCRTTHPRCSGRSESGLALTTRRMSCPSMPSTPLACSPALCCCKSTTRSPFVPRVAHRFHLIEFSSNSKSGEFFFYTHDGMHVCLALAFARRAQLRCLVSPQVGTC